MIIVGSIEERIKALEEVVPNLQRDFKELQEDYKSTKEEIAALSKRMDDRFLEIMSYLK